MINMDRQSNVLRRAARRYHLSLLQAIDLFAVRYRRRHEAEN